MKLNSISYVFDSSTIIYLGKVKLLYKVGTLPGAKFIPTEVYNEVVQIGRAKNEPEIEYVIKVIEDKILVIKNVEKLIISANGLSKADAEVLSLAKNTRSIAIIDERRANSLAESYGIETHGLIYILLLLVREKIISKDEALINLDKIIDLGFYLSNSKYMETVNKINII